MSAQETPDYAQCMRMTAPVTSFEKYTADVLADIALVKAKLLVEGVEEQDYPSYMPGVVAVNFGGPVPPLHNSEHGPKLPKGLVAKEVFDKMSLQHIKECADASKVCSDIVAQMSSVEKLKPIRNVDRELTDLNNRLYHALQTAGHYSAKKTKFYLDYTPYNAEAFYARITPLFNELDTLAERLRDVRRNLV